VTTDDALALALGYLRQTRLAFKRTGGGRKERTILLRDARMMVEQARTAMQSADHDPAAAAETRKLLQEVEAALVTAENELARESARRPLGS
jgi:hypothetical protein